MNRKNVDQPKEVAKQIMIRLKQMFKQHEKKVDQKNKDRNLGGKFPQSDQTISFYNQLYTLIDALKTLRKKIRGVDKLRNQRKQLYEGKTRVFIDVLEKLEQKKLLRIKVNDHVLQMVKKTLGVIEEVNRNLVHFEKQGAMICGSIHSAKIGVEQSMTELIEYGFLWGNISKFDSVAQRGAQQIFVPVEYDENSFKDIQNEVIRLWPQPQIIQIEKNISVPTNNSDKIREAHQLLFGFTRPQNIAQSIRIYKQQSQKSECSPIVYNALGHLYEQGKYLPIDHKKAVDFYLKSAKMNDPEGIYKIGQYLEKGLLNSKQIFQGLYTNRQSEICGSIQHYEKAAKLGHLDAITDLGYIYEKGINNEDGTSYYVHPHPQFAQKYYLKAKKSAFPRALNNLGGLYITCDSLSEDVKNSNLEKGIRCLEKAVEAKYLKAFVNLGKCYENGVGVHPNEDRARALFLQGAEYGDIDCRLQYVKSYLGQNLSDDNVMIKLVELTRQVLIVDRNNSEALYFMGLFMQKGIGTDINKQSSFYYISASAKQDYAPAITKLGDYYYSGYHVPKNYEIAKQLYQKGVEKMNSQAYVNLGVMIQKGLINKENQSNNAKQYYEEAAKMGNTNAVLMLGLTKQSNFNNSTVIKAAEMGNVNAVRILNKTSMSLMPHQQKKKVTYQQAMNQISSTINYPKKQQSRIRSTLHKNFLS